MSRRRGTVRHARIHAFTLLLKPGIAPGFSFCGRRGRATPVSPAVDESERAAGTV
jgi:hypothetical protein